MQQIADIPRLLPWPQLINIVLGGRTPDCRTRSSGLRYAGVIYANVALQSAVLGMQAALYRAQAQGHMGDATKLVVDFSERQRLVEG